MCNGWSLLTRKNAYYYLVKKANQNYRYGYEITKTIYTHWDASEAVQIWEIHRNDVNKSVTSNVSGIFGKYRLLAGCIMKRKSVYDFLFREPLFVTWPCVRINANKWNAMSLYLTRHIEYSFTYLTHYHPLKVRYITLLHLLSSSI